MYTHPIWEELKKIARQKYSLVILCEGEDERILRAADIISQEKLAQISIIGNKKSIEQKVRALGISRESIRTIDPLDNPDTQAIAGKIYERCKTKGISEKDALELAHSRLHCGFGLVALGKAAAAVSGAVENTSDTVRAAMNCLSTAKGHKIITGLFLVEAPFQSEYGFNGAYVFGDCGVTPDPSPRMLARIAREAADCFSFYFKTEPKVAFLSFSTLGSAQHERVDKVKEAVSIARKQLTGITIDGEFQLDTALDKQVAQRKGADSSEVAGKANVLIFPDLDSGNIAYKAAQRFGGARTIGPILWGLEKPISDLSRGCSVEDIIYTVCALSAQC